MVHESHEWMHSIYGDNEEELPSGPLLSKYLHPQNAFGYRILRVCCDLSMT